MQFELVLPANLPPKQSAFIDFDSKQDAADLKGHAGDVKSYQPCAAGRGFPRRRRWRWRRWRRRRLPASCRCRRRRFSAGRRRRRRTDFPPVAGGGGPRPTRRSKAVEEPRPTRRSKAVEEPRPTRRSKAAAAIRSSKDRLRSPRRASRKAATRLIPAPSPSTSRTRPTRRSRARPRSATRSAPAAPHWRRQDHRHASCPDLHRRRPDFTCTDPNPVPPHTPVPLTISFIPGTLGPRPKSRTAPHRPQPAERRRKPRLRCLRPCRERPMASKSN